MTKYHDWHSIRQAYITTEFDLKALASPRIKGNPTIATLKRYAEAEDWDAQRLAHQQAKQEADRAKEKQRSESLDSLFEEAEVITRHLKLTRSLQALYSKAHPKIMSAIEGMDFSQLSPKQITMVMRDLAALVQAATEIERKAMGLVDPATQVQLETRYVISTDVAPSSDPDEAIADWMKTYSLPNQQN